MRGGNLQKARYFRESNGAPPAPRANLRSVTPPQRSAVLHERRETRKAHEASIYRRRRVMAIGLFFSFVLALVLAVILQAPDAAEPTVPIDPGNAAPDTVLAKAAGIDISTPIRPESLTGLGYHPEGESLVEMEPRGENLSANPLVGLLSNGSTAEDIHHHVMYAAGRTGPRTGAPDVGAPAG